MQTTGTVAAGLIGGRLVGPMRALQAAEQARAAGKKPPNVLMMISDDLNDWCGCYGGHPQARTPNIDRLAGRGVRFDCAHVQMPWCGPSRASLLTGLLPSSTGIYRNDPCQLANYTGTKDALTLPRCFAAAGYETLGVGKIYHRTSAVDYASEFDTYAGESMGCGRFGPRPPKPIHWGKGGRLLDWGAYPQRDEQMADHKMADWAID
jgi:arylsulfatase A-like enzyme